MIGAGQVVSGLRGVGGTLAPPSSKQAWSDLLHPSGLGLLTNACAWRIYGLHVFCGWRWQDELQLRRTFVDTEEGGNASRRRDQFQTDPKLSVELDNVLCIRYHVPNVLVTIIRVYVII